jgi:hypothetical protein
LPEWQASGKLRRHRIFDSADNMAADTAHSLIGRDSLALSTPYVAPKDELEAKIATAFAEVFTLDHVGVDDDFFDLGGDSLLAEILGTVLSERIGQSFEISLLLEHGSPKRIATLLKLNQ